PAEMGAPPLKECGVPAESYETPAVRHGPFELAGAALGAIVIATEPETLSLALGLGADAVERGRGRRGLARRAGWGAGAGETVGGRPALVRGLHRPDPAARLAAGERAGARPRRLHQG